MRSKRCAVQNQGITLSYWGEGRRRPAGQRLETCLLCRRSTINYTNLQMGFNVEWNRKGSSFVRGFAVSFGVRN